MQIVALTALGVGGATVIGAVIGFFFKNISQKTTDMVLSFAAGVMLAAAIFGLITPSMDMAGKSGVWMTAAGIICGALVLNLADYITPHLHHITGAAEESHSNNASLDKVMLFVIAIAIHNLPEGLAAGVSFGSGDIGNAISVAAGIAIQNIPEGMVVITPMLVSGIKPARAFVIAAFTGMIEVVGTFIGYFAVTISAGILPFSLAFAGGTMLYIISDEMIPDTHRRGNERAATYTLIVGFIAMMILDVVIG